MSFFRVPMLIAFFLAGQSFSAISESSDTLLQSLSTAFVRLHTERVFPKNVKPDSVYYSAGGDTITVRISSEFGLLPVREVLVEQAERVCREVIEQRGISLPIQLISAGLPLREYIPELYKSKQTRAVTKHFPQGGNAFVTPADDSRIYRKGLSGHNMIIWHSHGRYYSNGAKRWEWQRPRLFETVEDLVPFSYVVQFLVPMMENSGAYIFMPQERDTQKEELLVDNDKAGSGMYSEISKGKAGGKKNTWRAGEGKGFLSPTQPLEDGDNPFRSGTYRIIDADKNGTASAEWKAKISKPGMYSVSVGYVSLANSVSDAMYTVHYSGGEQSFVVNQQKGGGTWIYLGTFYFTPGGTASVTLTNKSSKPGVVTADVARFGGGMGNVARGGSVSGSARYLEGARYWLQYAGMPDTLIYSLNKGENDYRDDYQSRAEYGNYLTGAPGGPNRERNNIGLGIPLSLSLAFHTDAGITQNDTVIGSLAIYSSTGAKGEKDFPSGGSRMINRDLSDIVQTQIVGDIRKTFDSYWTRRQLRDADYSEATRPNVPALLLEAFSHQNFADMRLHHNPAFRFTLARAIYKGIVKFLQQDSTAMVQPLPVHKMRAELNDNACTITWEQTIDPLEVNSGAEKYRVYIRKGTGGFDAGRIVNTASYTIKNMKKGELYSVKVSAVNDAGESFPSETVCAAYAGLGANHVLIVNGFTRVSEPKIVDEPAFSGFMRALDEGVAWGIESNITGFQYDYLRSSVYRSNDEPGHGGSGAERETEQRMGNSFDGISVHAEAFAGLQYSVSSCSEAAFSLTPHKRYSLIDYVYGEQKATARINHTDTIIYYQLFPKAVMRGIEAYLAGGGNMILSGSYIASDAVIGISPDTAVQQFCKKFFGFQFNSSFASRTGKVVPAQGETNNFPSFTFAVTGNEHQYGAEAAGSLTPSGKAKVFLRYAENLTPAAVGFAGKGGTAAFGFPLETLHDKKYLKALIAQVLHILKGKKQ